MYLKLKSVFSAKPFSRLYGEKAGLLLTLSVLGVLFYFLHFLVFLLPISYGISAALSICLQTALFYLCIMTVYTVFVEFDSKKRLTSVIILALNILLSISTLVSLFYMSVISVLLVK